MISSEDVKEHKGSVRAGPNPWSATLLWPQGKSGKQGMWSRAFHWKDSPGRVDSATRACRGFRPPVPWSGCILRLPSPRGFLWKAHRKPYVTVLNLRSGLRWAEQDFQCFQDLRNSWSFPDFLLQNWHCDHDLFRNDGRPRIPGNPKDFVRNVRFPEASAKRRHLRCKKAWVVSLFPAFLPSPAVGQPG